MYQRSLIPSWQIIIKQSFWLIEIHKTIDALGHQSKYDPYKNNSNDNSHIQQTLTHQYDEIGNRIATTLPDGKVINQLYYGSGHLYNQSITGTDGNITEIRHSERDQLHQETTRQQGDLLSSFGYDAMGRLTKQYSSDHNKGRIVIERDYHYDVLGQLTHLSGQTQLNSQTNSTVNSSTNSLFQRNHQYDYDKVGRLTQHKLTDYTKQSGTTERFAFDPASNRVPVSTAVNDDKAQEKNSIHKSGRPTKLITADKLITYTYGIHGQVLFKTLTPAKDGKPIPQSTHALVSSRKSIQHYYNPNNELIKTITNTEEGFTLTEVTTTYYYDAFGRRIAKASDTKVKTKFINSKPIRTVKHHIQQQKTKQQTTLMLWDGNRQAQEYTDTHVFTTVYEQDSFEPVARLVWLKDELLKAANDDIKNAERESWEDEPKLIPNMQIYYYHNDHLGTPNELTSQDGEVVWLADYEAWGNTAKVVWREEKLEQLQVSADELQPIRFQGQSFDVETGLHYNRFRYYDPDLGMFVSRDPIGLMGGSNVFQYAPNPTGWIDPFGLSCIQWISPFDLNFSQGYVTDPQYSEILSDMQKNGWDVNKSVLEVAIIDGQKVSLDNRRLLAAQNANLSQVPIRIVDLDAPRPDGGTYGSNLSKKLKSRPPRRRDLNPIDVGPQGTPNKPKVVSSKKPCP